jgi:hypothetical protein
VPFCRQPSGRLRRAANNAAMKAIAIEAFSQTAHRLPETNERGSTAGIDRVARPVLRKKAFAFERSFACCGLSALATIGGRNQAPQTFV